MFYKVRTFDKNLHSIFFDITEDATGDNVGTSIYPGFAPP